MEAAAEDLWAEVGKETRGGRAGGGSGASGRRCDRAVLDFLTSTDVGRRVPAEEDTVSEVSEAELREWMEEHGAEPDTGGSRHCSFPRLAS